MQTADEIQSNLADPEALFGSVDSCVSKGVDRVHGHDSRPHHAKTFDQLHGGGTLWPNRSTTSRLTKVWLAWPSGVDDVLALHLIELFDCAPVMVTPASLQLDDE